MSYFRQRMAEIDARRVVGTKEGYVYFLESADSQSIKIGFTTDLSSRMASIKTAHPGAHLAEYIRTYAEAERLFHERFKADRVEGEWFTYTDDIDEMLADLWDCKFAMATRECRLDGQAFMDALEEQLIDIGAVNTILATINEPWPANFP